MNIDSAFSSPSEKHLSNNIEPSEKNTYQTIT
jgi:hypothetical protein